MKLYALACLAIVAGCQTQPVQEMTYTQQKAWAKGIYDSCQAQGVRVDEMAQCLDAESRRDSLVRHRNAVTRREFGRDMGRAFQRQSDHYYRMAY